MTNRFPTSVDPSTLFGGGFVFKYKFEKDPTE